MHMGALGCGQAPCYIQSSANRLVRQTKPRTEPRAAGASQKIRQTSSVRALFLNKIYLSGALTMLAAHHACVPGYRNAGHKNTEQMSRNNVPFLPQSWGPLRRSATTLECDGGKARCTTQHLLCQGKESEDDDRSVKSSDPANLSCRIFRGFHNAVSVKQASLSFLSHGTSQGSRRAESV
ncbi:hypothetical protein COCC4DRAFT_25444 [Bipolaris maydis ATCC 48331]|uniref:Uncharacterized protein n=2 Tax=Cochliobolus heterostrophus TaxID=5016 RepID=M2UHF3_COCH5|nr:uncharacterized protein COCC4DRAFT_25444 [Bipolaris maydis ATCC 48331]EMD97874.1 hypothetical protein COCHEDRAFT_1026210 [Bipolaris maydis C5]ENI02729.1 hypothetical protein COCC4DRAFT_25444 [Bipolaris maydis ATCC 48331]